MEPTLNIVVNPESETFHEALGIAEKKADDLVDAVIEVVRSMPDQFSRAELLDKALSVANGDHEIIFVAMYVQFLSDKL